MSSAPKSSFVYVTYIKTTPERLWSALTSSDFAQQYWLGAPARSRVEERRLLEARLPGRPRRRLRRDRRVRALKRLAIRWRNEFMPEMKAEGWSLCTMEIEPAAATPSS